MQSPYQAADQYSTMVRTIKKIVVTHIKVDEIKNEENEKVIIFFYRLYLSIL